MRQIILNDMKAAPIICFSVSDEYLTTKILNTKHGIM
jgi:hypothetical protein